MKIVKPSVSLVWITKNPEHMIEYSARKCYKSEDKTTINSAGKFCKMLKDHNHGAMLEHAVASFEIVTDRGIMAEITRHRIASFAVTSTRYVNYSNDKFGNEISVIEPPGLINDSFSNWIYSCKIAEESYLQMIKKGIKPQIARSVLPTCTMTEIAMTANFREWLHFVNLRSSKAAHPQIRPIAIEINDILADHAPSIFEKM